MDTFTEEVQSRIEQMVVDLRSDDDYLPFMVVVDHRSDKHLIGMAMPEEPEEKNALADVMTSICCIRRATQVAFSSIAWQVIRVKPDDLDDLPAPSQCEDRQEVVFLTVVDEHGSTSYTASLIRENNLVGVGLWEKMASTVAWQRFANAIHMGIQMGKSMPPDVAEFVDLTVDSGRESMLAEKITQMISQAREAITRQMKEANE